MIKRTKGQSVLEFMTVFGLIVLSMIIMQKFVLRAMMGKMKTAGEQISYGIQYDPKKTISCLRFIEHDKEVWRPEKCVYDHGGSAFECDDDCRDDCPSGVCNQK